MIYSSEECYKIVYVILPLLRHISEIFRIDIPTFTFHKIPFKKIPRGANVVQSIQKIHKILYNSSRFSVTEAF